MSSDLDMGGDADLGQGVEPCVHGEEPATCGNCLDDAARIRDPAALLDGPLSVPSSTMRGADEDEEDRMIQAASAPSLASLFKAGKERGLIGPTTTYGETA